MRDGNRRGGKEGRGWFEEGTRKGRENGSQALSVV